LNFFEEPFMSAQFLSRLGNLWKGFLSLWISDVETRHPEIAYQNSIDSMIAKYSKLKQATAALIRRRQDIQNRLDKANAEMATVQRDLDAAVATDQDDLAIVLIQKKNQLEADLQGMNMEMAQAEKDAESAKASLVQVKAEIDNLKAEKDRMLAQMNSASARIKIQDQLEGLSVDAEVKALSNVRDHIKNTVAQANLGDELRENDLDVRLNKLRQSSSGTLASTELAALKAKRQQAAQATTEKAM
jgi:phage shock protein A